MEFNPLKKPQIKLIIKIKRSKIIPIIVGIMNISSLGELHDN